MTEMHQTRDIPEECRNSAAQILSYAGLAPERADLFIICLDAFIEQKDKLSVDKESLNIRDAITPVFWEVYAAAARRSASEKPVPRLIRMFLDFSYMEDRLLTDNEIHALWSHYDIEPSPSSISVYEMSGWLARIYQGEKVPSINEHGLDYFEVFRDKRKRGELTENDKMWWDGNHEGRLNHEIEGLVRMGQRLSYGRMAGYFPILHSQMVGGDIKRTMVTRQRIENCLNHILGIDHTAFHREIVYHQPEKGIIQQLIMKRIIPNIILLPVCGKRGVMWQELTARQSASPGRFLLPALCSEELELLIIDLVAKFRWYLSKAVSTSMRKEASTMSLYNDYTNYLQFYKKNRDLSGDARDKIKTLLDRHRNNMIEIFSGDYRTWILFESKGLMRLNKVSREIIFRYCPFPRPMRERLEKQPIFNQMVTQYNNICARELKSLEARYNKISKGSSILDPELAENLQFYRD